ncbi:MAG: hypothetical protein HBSAPP03_10430 [Phycisphaerae bacterium]|nr:MAG: hypothetical protein HBSAPP03_10430 [Phycisphaerae bacterium]
MPDRNRVNVRVMATGLLALVGGLLVGCSNRSFFDPSTNGAGRWGRTPVAMPVLTRIAAIEDDTGDLVEFSDPLPGDLVPQPMQYRLGQGDALRVTMYDLIETNRAETYDVEVDARGMIELPQLGRVRVGGQTTEQATETVKEAMKRLVANPLASVQAMAQRQQTFNLVGAVDKPGPYYVPRANYRLLEAISAGGRFDDTGEWVYVIREVSLAEETAGEVRPAESPTKPGENVLDLIDEIAPPKPQPGMLRGAGQPEKGRTAPPPVVALPDEGDPVKAGAKAASPVGTTRWVFLNGKWVQVAAAVSPAGSDGLPEPTETMVTQRVIRVPIKELVAGKQAVNIVVRPGDVVRIPNPPVGTVYIAGQVARPGTYTLPPTGGLTLMRAIHAAGGYQSLAIPSRIDLTRVVGKDREATIMVDGAAIANRTQPDFYLKPNDSLMVGTNFWAYPLAVVRNGFRASYGFGFVLDRNIGNDIFGPPPVNQFGQ